MQGPNYKNARTKIQGANTPKTKELTPKKNTGTKMQAPIFQKKYRDQFTKKIQAPKIRAPNYRELTVQNPRS